MSAAWRRPEHLRFAARYGRKVGWNSDRVCREKGPEENETRLGTEKDRPGANGFWPFRFQEHGEWGTEARERFLARLLYFDTFQNDTQHRCAAPFWGIACALTPPRQEAVGPKKYPMLRGSRRVQLSCLNAIYTQGMAFQKPTIRAGESIRVVTMFPSERGRFLTSPQIASHARCKQNA